MIHSEVNSKGEYTITHDQHKNEVVEHRLDYKRKEHGRWGSMTTQKLRELQSVDRNTIVPFTYLYDNLFTEEVTVGRQLEDIFKSEEETRNRGLPLFHEIPEKIRSTIVPHPFTMQYIYKIEADEQENEDTKTITDMTMKSEEVIIELLKTKNTWLYPTDEFGKMEKGVVND